MERPSGGGSRERRADRRTDARVSAVPCPARAMPSEKEEDEVNKTAEADRPSTSAERESPAPGTVAGRARNRAFRREAVQPNARQAGIRLRGLMSGEAARAHKREK